MEPSSPVKIVEFCKIAPSPPPLAEFSLPLSLFDLIFINITPTERIFFYSLTAGDPPFMNSILPKLKHSLAITLSHFLPLAGNLTWPEDSPEPFILYKPGDAVSLTVAETDAEFSRLSATRISNAAESLSLVPELHASDGNTAPAMSLQITLFPNSGFSVGITTNHVVADGKTTTTFMKSWASICKLNLPSLPQELTLVFDRTAVKDPSGIDALYSKYLSAITASKPKSEVRNFGLAAKAGISQGVARRIFELTRGDIEILRKKAATDSQTRYLSSFVLTYAHTSTCLIKARKMEGMITLAFLVDLRSRSKFPVAANYFGNGIYYRLAFVEVSEVEDENGLAITANKISDAIVELEEMAKKKSAVEILEGLSKRGKEGPMSKTIAASGSPRFGVYETDFGWGSCMKVEMPSIDAGKVISLAESRNGNGGIEVGIALQDDAMEVFTSLFMEGMKRDLDKAPM